MNGNDSNPLASKRRWTEYLVEFVMLFAAVTLGFFAENIREQNTEQQKKKELLAAVVHDFKTDKSEIERHRVMVKRRLENCENFQRLLEMDESQIDVLNFYRTAILHAENKDLILNEKARDDAEAKGYFSNGEFSEMSGILNKFNYYFNDYEELNLGCLESCKRYYSTIIPDLLEAKLVLKSDFIWQENGSTTDKDFQGKLNKKIDQELKDKILFDIWSRKTLLLLELSNFDTLDLYADKAIAVLTAEELN
ncbi:MAG: hypothetical protein FJZ76_04265 [Bacteroidetes bacterium]|nr:hypothetical protein [Bacteroidota bacterium]